jgi:hypothetical protein
LQPNGGAQRNVRMTSEADIMATEERSSAATCARAVTQPAAIAPATASVANTARIFLPLGLTSDRLDALNRRDGIYGI